MLLELRKLALLQKDRVSYVANYDTCATKKVKSKMQCKDFQTQGQSTVVCSGR